MKSADQLSRSQVKLDSQAVLLLVILTMFNTATALSGTFIPVYLWKESQSYALIGWFSFCQFAMVGISCWLAGKWVKQFNKMHALRLGVALSGCFYLSVLLLGAKSQNYFILLGMLSGIASGLFWLAYNVVYFEITGPDNRDRYNGWGGLLASGARMLSMAFRTDYYPICWLLWLQNYFWRCDCNICYGRNTKFLAQEKTRSRCLHVVFGCARAREKRQSMAKVCTRHHYARDS